MLAKNKNLDIFVYGVKAFTPLVTNPVYKILTNSDDPYDKFNTQLEVHRDFEGDGPNITDKNLLYNEYTGAYWVWKNWPLKQYVGFNHYRRYFDCLDDLPDINKIFQKNRIILNSKFFMLNNRNPINNRDFYAFWHNLKDFDLMEQCVKDLYPEYSDGWDKMAKSTHIYPSSIMIMNRNMFDEYMQYIFDVTEEFNDRIGCHSNQEYIEHVAKRADSYIKPKYPYYTIEKQARIIGYLIERCLCAFLMHKEKGKTIEDCSYQLPWHVFDVKYND